MKIIDIENSLLQFDNDDWLVTPIFTNEKHPASTKLSLIFITSLSTDESSVLAFNHHEARQLPSNLLEKIKLPGRVFTVDKKQLLHALPLKNIFDVSLLYYFLTNRSPEFDIEETSAHKLIRKNNLIPIGSHYKVHIEMLEQVKNVLSKTGEILKDESFEFFNETAAKNMQQIEKTGLYNNTGQYEFTEYNFLTSAGRPSNRFGGVNYAALNRDDDTRKRFISRYGKDGCLLEFDYSAYHLTLIAELIGYDFDKSETLHDHLGRYYFQTDKLTEEQYKRSKEISFKQLYGGISKEYKHIDYFKMVSQLIKKTWVKFDKQGFVESFLTGKKLYKKNLPNMKPQKLFNYLLQLSETERNVAVISKILDRLENEKTKLILYTYDSFLFDFNFEDGKEVARDIKSILESGDNFKVTAKSGPNYANMYDITNKFDE